MRIKAKQDLDGLHRPERLRQRRLVCQDITIEKVTEVLEDNPRGVLVSRDELGAWLSSFCRYKGQEGGTDLPNWLEIHRRDGRPLEDDRKTGDRPTVVDATPPSPSPAAFSLGALAHALTAEFIDAGLGCVS